MAPTDRSRTPPDGGNTTKLAVASGVGVPPLTVWLGSAMYTFPVDRDVIVGRDRGCDICFHDINPDDLTLISRVHAILRFDNSQWVVVDKSQNGIYVAGARATLVPIHDRLTITLGSPHGPQLTFRVAPSAPPSRPDKAVGSSPKTAMFRPAGPPPPTRTQTRPPLRPTGPQSHPSRPLPPTGQRHQAGDGPAADRGFTGFGDGRACQDQHRRRRRRAGLPRARGAGHQSGRPGNPRQQQQQWHIRQRHPDQPGDVARRRRRHDRQYRPARDRQHPGAAARGSRAPAGLPLTGWR